MAFFTNALRVEHRLEKYSRVFRPWGACAFATQFAGRGAIACALRKKVEGGGTTAYLGYLLGKRDGGVGASGCLRYCYQHFKKLWEGEDARNAFKEVTVAPHVVRAMAKS